MLIFAMRYTLGRMTFAPSIVAENVRRIIHDISEPILELMIKDIYDQGKMSYGMECDKELWLSLAKDLEDELVLRQE